MAVNLTNTNFSYIEGFKGGKTYTGTFATPDVIYDPEDGLVVNVALPITLGQGVIITDANIFPLQNAGASPAEGIQAVNFTLQVICNYINRINVGFFGNSNNSIAPYKYLYYPGVGTPLVADCF